MPSITSNGTVIVRVAGALYGIAPGNAIYNELVNASYATAGGVNSLLNSLYASDFGAAKTSDVGAAVAANLGLTGDAAAEATAYLKGVLDAAPANARGQVIANALTLFAGLTSDAKFGAAATAWNTKVANATTTAQTAGSADAAFSNVSAVLAGKTIALTANVDNLAGTDGADTFTGTQDTVTSTDSISGGAGADKLQVTSSGAGVTLGAGVTGVESLQVTYTADQSGAFNVKDAVGYNEVKVLNTAFNSSVSNIAKAATVVLENVTGIKTATIAYLAGDLTGSADAVSLTLLRVGSSSQGITIANSSAGIEAQTITSSGGAANNVASLTLADTVKTLTIAGDQNLTVTDLVISAPALTTVDASAATKNVSLDLVVGTARDLNVKGGSGNDTFTFGDSLNAADTVDGGAGTDTIVVSQAIAANVALTGFEGVTYTNTATHSATQANLTGITTVGQAGAAVTVTNATSGANLVAAATGGTFTVSLKAGTDSALDTVNLQNGLATSTSGISTTFKSSVIEQINLNSITKDAGTQNTLTVGNNTTNSVSKIYITGNADNAIADGGSYASELLVDASASTGALTYNGVSNVAETVIGGAGNDAFIFAAGEFTADDSINGGAGNDTLTITATDNADTAFGRLNASVENVAIAAIDQDKANSADFRSVSSLVAVSATIVDVGSGSTLLDNLPATVTKATIVGDSDLSGAGADDNMTGTITIDTDGGSALTVVLNSDNDVNGGNNYSTTFGVSGTNQQITLTGTATAYTFAQAGTGNDADFINVTAANATSLSFSTASRAQNIATLSADKLTAVTVSGTNAFSVNAFNVATGSKLASLDASGLSGALSLGATSTVEKASAAVITAGSGDDTIQFGINTDGATTITAGTNSTVSSSNAGDTLRLTGSLAGTTSIDLSSATDQVVTLNGVASAGAQTGFEAIDGSSLVTLGVGLNVTGSSGANSITGSAGNDVIDGGAGNDTITGGAGNDLITTGVGVDTIKFSGGTTALNGVDTITDFTPGTTGDILNFAAIATNGALATTVDATGGGKDVVVIVNSTLASSFGYSDLATAATANKLALGDDDDCIVIIASSTSATSAKIYYVDLTGAAGAGSNDTVTLIGTINFSSATNITGGAYTAASGTLTL